MNFLSHALSFVQGSGASDCVAAILTVLGALRVIAQYTPWTADDHFFAAVEAPFKAAAAFISKLKGAK